MLTQTELQDLIESIVARLQPEKVIIFGSYAKGTATIRSDVDIFIIKETLLPMVNRADDVLPILTNLFLQVDVHVYTPEEVEVYIKEPFSFVHTVLQTGITVYEKGR